MAFKQVWSEESMRGRAKALGYWIVKIIAHQHDYWYLVKQRKSIEPIFIGKKGKDFVSLGALGSPDAVMAAISVLEDQAEERRESKAE